MSIVMVKLNCESEYIRESLDFVLAVHMVGDILVACTEMTTSEDPDFHLHMRRHATMMTF